MSLSATVMQDRVASVIVPVSSCPLLRVGHGPSSQVMCGLVSQTPTSDRGALRSRALRLELVEECVATPDGIGHVVTPVHATEDEQVHHPTGDAHDECASASDGEALLLKA